MITNQDVNIRRAQEVIENLEIQLKSIKSLLNGFIAAKYVEIIMKYNRDNNCDLVWDMIFKITPEIHDRVGKSFDACEYAKVSQFNETSIAVAPCDVDGKGYGFIEIVPIELVLDAMRLSQES
jgi:hypothetical protein